MSKFEELLGELDKAEVLVKALPAPTDEDARVKAAAKEAGAGTDGAEPDAGAGDPPAEGEGEDDPMTKSFKVVLEDGTEVDAFDGTAMVKALGGQVDALGKALPRVVGLVTTLIGHVNERDEMIKAQGLLLKSLEGQVAAFGNQGRGRTGILTVVEKPVAENLTPAKVTVGELLAKAQTLFDAKKINGIEFTTIGASLQSGRKLAPYLEEKLTA